MKTKDILLSITITILLGVFVFFVGSPEETLAAPNEVYQVYLNGETIGYLNSKKKFLELVDNKQEEIKRKFNVNKVYPPNGLEIEKTNTYNTEIKTAEEIYQIIEKNNPFTIDGYTITIKYDDQNKKPVYIHTLKKEYFEEAFIKTMSAFIGTESLENYKNKTQKEINETGSIIESIYWDEKITTKESHISVTETIFTNSNDLGKYLLFGTTEKQKSYIVKEGDSINEIIEKNNLSIEEFLIANPSIPDQNTLLTKNQEVSIGLIAPIVTIVHEEQLVEDITNKYVTEYRDDNTMYQGQTKTIQEGSNGISRVTEEILYRNGDIQNLVISKKEEISPTINKIVNRGTKAYYTPNYTYVNVGNQDWYWPTVSPFKIMSFFGYRWGRQHKGIDISGCGFGSPIYSSTDGVVIEVNSNCADTGYYGNSCGGQYGNYIKIETEDGYIINYAHMKKNLTVKVGDKVSRGQNIGYMGSSGSSTGTHLHYEIRNSSNTPINPCKTVFSC